MFSGTYAHNYSEFYMWKEVDSYLSRKYDSAVRLTIAMSYIDWSHQNTYPGHLMSPVKIYDRAQVRLMSHETQHLRFSLMVD